MDRRHLWADDRVILAHLFREDDTLVVGRLDGALLMLFLLDADRGQERANTDTGGTEVVDFIDLQAGVNLAGTG